MATFVSQYADALDIELGSNDSSVLFTSARRKHAINEGYRQFCDLTECLVRQSTVTVSSSAQEFDLNSTTILPGGDFIRLASQGPIYQISDTASNVRTIAGDQDFPQREIPWLDSAQSGWRSTATGTPTGWYQRRFGGSFFFGLDTPANVSTSETAWLVIPYVPRPTSLVNDTDVFFSINSTSRGDLQLYAQAAVHYAAHNLEKLRKDKQAAAEQLQMFTGYVQRYLQATRPKGARSIRMGRSYFKEARRTSDVESANTPWWRS